MKRIRQDFFCQQGDEYVSSKLEGFAEQKPYATQQLNDSTTKL